MNYRDLIRHLTGRGDKGLKIPEINENSRKGVDGEVAAYKFFTVDFKWLYTPIPRENDFGIDGYVEITEKNHPTGKAFVAQVKKGKSHFNGFTSSSFYFTFDEKHYNYWNSQQLPVIFVLDPEDGSGNTYWGKFNANDVEINGATYKLKIFKYNVVDPYNEKAAKDIANEVEFTNEMTRKLVDLEMASELYRMLEKNCYGRFKRTEHVEILGDLAFINFEFFDKNGNYQSEMTFYCNYNIELDQYQHMEKMVGLSVLDYCPVEEKVEPFHEDLDDEDDDNTGLDDKGSDEETEEEEKEYRFASQYPNDFYIVINDIGKAYLRIRNHFFGGE